MRTIDPVLIAPRAVARDWGRAELGEWSGLVGETDEAIGEVWVSHGVGISAHGQLDALIASDTDAALGLLGRAPPLARLVFPGRRVRIASTPPMGFWIVLDPGQTGIGPVRHPGERIFARDGSCLDLAPGSIALEVSPSVISETSSKVATPLTWSRAASPRARATLQRDKALSVEMWTLPPRSSLTPDGRCCHVAIAVSHGAIIHDKPLRPGDALMVPARGRAIDIVADRADARIIIAYPDIVATAVWSEPASNFATLDEQRDPHTSNFC